MALSIWWMPSLPPAIIAPVTTMSTSLNHPLEGSPANTPCKPLPSTGRVAGQHSMQAPDADQCQCQAQDETDAIGGLLGVDAVGSKGFLFGRKYLGKGINVRLNRQDRGLRGR